MNAPALQSLTIIIFEDILSTAESSSLSFGEGWGEVKQGLQFTKTQD